MSWASSDTVLSASGPGGSGRIPHVHVSPKAKRVRAYSSSAHLHHSRAGHCGAGVVGRTSTRSRCPVGRRIRDHGLSGYRADTGNDRRLLLQHRHTPQFREVAEADQGDLVSIGMVLGVSPQSPDCYVVLHLHGQRRLYGWPEEWPSRPDEGHFRIAEGEWLVGDERIPATGVTAIVVPAKEVDMVEFLRMALPDEH